MGIFDFFKKKQPEIKKENFKENKAANTPQPIVEVKKMGRYPQNVNGHPLRYHYVFELEPLENINVEREILKNEEKIVDVSSNGDYVELIYEGVKFAHIFNPHKAEMVSDWIKKDLPCHAILLSSGDKINLRFYKDKRIGNEWREQDVVALTSYKSDSKQENIWLLSPGDEVDLEEDFDHEDSVIVTALADQIGKLPKKWARKVINEGYYAAFIDKVEDELTEDELTNDFNSVKKPYIKIYWKD